ncbi:MAG: multiple sugar transport system permease protein [Acidimicrobiales bacterium]|jgi:multiple sugar transport system permease protein
MSAVAGDGQITKKRNVYLAQIFLVVLVALWMVPLVGMVVSSFRPLADTNANGIFSWPDSLTMNNFQGAWERGNMPRHWLVTGIVVVPALILVLFFSSMVAFAVSRYSWKFNLSLLMLFTAGNLLPPQTMIQPLFQIYRRIPLPEIPLISDTGEMRGSLIGLILIHVAFQSGFCTFVLSNYMKTLPKELNEAAQVDGASMWRQYWQIIMPLTRPALAALATLEFSWIYNDFFWAVVLIQKGDNLPITSSLQNLSGQFFTDDNLVAAGSLLVALPTILVYLILRRQFIGGLAVGASKG